MNAHGVQLGVVRRPAVHDFFVVEKLMACRASIARADLDDSQGRRDMVALVTERYGDTQRVQALTLDVVMNTVDIETVDVVRVQR